jgi:hypothetical protein
MELYLRDNDPTRTLLITASGEELYKTETYQDGGATIVLRFQRHASAGLVALEVGRIESLQPRGTRLLLYLEHKQLVLRPPAIEGMDRCVVKFISDY